MDENDEQLLDFDKTEIAPSLHPDIVAHSPSPFADESGPSGADGR
ncbi:MULTISPECIES: hypothetical protein [Streptomyces]|nr:MULTISPECIES: hypothetical protein [Streptomyces]MDX3068269.1 hypothetical protein [Streptomyces sp. ND04-05B]MDX3519700.1 hypothetical protein [Streptomyces scabiei]